ncbi:neutral zinc metallopeptidase [Chamaesiphon minutus]|uniref:Putative metalloprotease n=1 Tax=Chamaesiphon minutus (strain ATCC 27169 / PCC 6605) TaxID=1173020 RepID=K9UNK9_CHAP6|nr:neutral zinc metallopeptidase [Chamaesiphon minutus]AFY96400.1 putative metalloprotease [Chamaesiphon minutus PCC 6605]
MNLGKFLTRVSLAFVTTIATHAPLQARQLGPEVVLKAVYLGLRQVDTTRANPKVRWNVPNGVSSPCGRIGGSLYCTRNNTIYITQQHIQMAYKYGDAALAYILAHEYAHAAQTIGGFRPNNITAIELQADCLAGFYMGAMPNVTFDRQDIEQIAEIAYQVGDYEFNNRQHHGTPEQRAKAVLLGFQASQKNGISACRVR